MTAKICQSALKRVELRYPPSPPADPRKFFRSIDAYMFWSEEPFEVWLYLRVSERPQKRNLLAQVISCLIELTARGIVVCGISDEICSGWKRNERVAFLAAIQAARPRGAILVGESLCRILRNELFHSVRAPDLQPTEAEAEWATSTAQGVPLVTILAPHLSNRIVRGYQTKRGQQWARGFMGSKKILRQAISPHVVNLLRCGWPLRSIAKKIQINESTLRGWPQVRGFFSATSEKRARR